MLRRHALISLAAACATDAAPATAAPGPVTAVVELDARPERLGELLALLHPVLDAMRHEATFVNAVLHRDRADPARLMVYETWADLDDLARVQVTRPYRRAYEAALPALLRSPRRVALWRPLRGDGMVPG